MRRSVVFCEAVDGALLASDNPLAHPVNTQRPGPLSGAAAWFQGVDATHTAKYGKSCFGCKLRVGVDRPCARCPRTRACLCVFPPSLATASSVRRGGSMAWSAASGSDDPAAAQGIRRARAGPARYSLVVSLLASTPSQGVRAQEAARTASATWEAQGVVGRPMSWLSCRPSSNSAPCAAATSDCATMAARGGGRPAPSRVLA